jgi:excinuclease ABC subunit A
VYLGDQRIGEITRLTIDDISEFLAGIRLKPEQLSVAGRVLSEIRKRLEFLVRVGLEYLSLDRLTSTLSGGEMQRIHLAASLGSSLVGSMYVLDEPSIGLHPRDQRRLVGILQDLRDLGNTVVVVEHEREIISAADRIIDVGPGAGELGGEIVFSGSSLALRSAEHSLTAKYLNGDLRISTPVFRRSSDRHLTVHGARQHNLKDITLEIPLGVFACITGVSGSGKSTLVHDVIYAGIKKLRNESKGPVGRFRKIKGWEKITEIHLVDQAPIGRTPRSNPVTYLKGFDGIRKLYASLRESRTRNLTPAHFSFNIPGGRCEACRGSGVITVEMQFLADVELQCEECRGTRFQKRILEITYKGKSIHDVLNLTVAEALVFFKDLSPLVRKLGLLDRVGLGYLRLGQSATTLSGGEAQRIKLASYLSKQTSRRPLFIFDEPTTGLHFDDINRLLRAFDTLIAKGASVLVIEHNLEVIKCADWIIDLGPEGGDRGGSVVAAGTPETIAQCAHSHTGRFLRDYVKV